jgi:hypothetical protein
LILALMAAPRSSPAIHQEADLSALHAIRTTYRPSTSRSAPEHKLAA